MAPQRNEYAAYVRVEKLALQSIVDRLAELGFRVVGPRVVDGAIALAELDSVDQLPIGFVDEQGGGRYELKQSETGSYFDYVVGPHSLKNYLFPSCQTVCKASKNDDGWSIETPQLPDQPIAAIGVRSCDLHALRIQDRVFMGGEYVDEAYRARREGIFLLAVNCRRAVDTCFCHSMGTGPAVSEGADLVLTEFDDYFVVRVDSDRGRDALASTPSRRCTDSEVEAFQAKPKKLEKSMRDESAAEGGRPRRHLEIEGLHDLLMSNLTHAQWDSVAERCIACGNCTMVCPTCFCSTVDEVTDLTGDQVQRERRWDSCFTAEHSRMHSGVVRSSTASRYRQWLTHKLATWSDQFDEIGCVGCGRCITWCPVGIDLTQEVAAIREDAS